MLAKSKTRKGGLGKNEHPDGLTTFKGNPGKNRGMKKLFPGGSKTRKGDPGKNGMMKKWKKWNGKNKHAKALTTDAMSKALTWLFQQAAIQSNCFTASCLQRWSRRVFKRRHPQKRNSCKCMSEREPLRAQYSSVSSVSAKLCLPNCQSSCIPEHPYMHNHASYMFMHLIKLLCYSYASAFSIPMLISIKINRVNFKFLLPTINVYCHANFKIQQSCQHPCQIQAPAVRSIKFNSFSNTICFC